MQQEIRKYIQLTEAKEETLAAKKKILEMNIFKIKKI